MGSDSSRQAHAERDSLVNPISARLATNGVHTGQQFADLMSAIMADLLSGEISPGQAQAACGAAGTLMRMVELQYRFKRTAGMPLLGGMNTSPAQLGESEPDGETGSRLLARTCPKCRAKLSADKRFVWCSECAWEEGAAS